MFQVESQAILLEYSIILDLKRLVSVQKWVRSLRECICHAFGHRGAHLLVRVEWTHFDLLPWIWRGHSHLGCLLFRDLRYAKTGIILLKRWRLNIMIWRKIMREIGHIWNHILMPHLIDDVEFILIYPTIKILIILIKLLHSLVHYWHSTCLLLLMLRRSNLWLPWRLSHTLPARQERDLFFEFLDLMLLILNFIQLRLHPHIWLNHSHLLLISHHRLLLLLQFLKFDLSLPILMLYFHLTSLFHLVIYLILSFNNISLELFEFQISFL